MPPKACPVFCYCLVDKVIVTADATMLRLGLNYAKSLFDVTFGRANVFLLRQLSRVLSDQRFLITQARQSRSCPDG